MFIGNRWIDLQGLKLRAQGLLINHFNTSKVVGHLQGHFYIDRVLASLWKEWGFLSCCGIISLSSDAIKHGLGIHSWFFHSSRSAAHSLKAEVCGQFSSNRQGTLHGPKSLVLSGSLARHTTDH